MISKRFKTRHHSFRSGGLGPHISHPIALANCEEVLCEPLSAYGKKNGPHWEDVIAFLSSDDNGAGFIFDPSWEFINVGMPFWLEKRQLWIVSALIFTPTRPK